MRDSCIFYRSFFDAIELLPKKYKLQFYEALFDYALNDVPPDKLSGSAAALFKALQPQIDANNRKYENGKKGGRPKKNQDETKPKPNDNQTVTKPKPNVNVNANANENGNGNGSGSEANSDAPSLSLFLIDYLNQRAGTSHEANDSVITMVQRLLDSGYSQEQMRNVIDKKCAEWLNDEKMRGYLRPSTLFGDKFSEYASAPISLALERKEEEENNRERLKKMRAEKIQTLEVLKASLEEIPRGTRMEERRILKDQIAQLEDSITIIDGGMS